MTGRCYSPWKFVEMGGIGEPELSLFFKGLRSPRLEARPRPRQPSRSFAPEFSSASSGLQRPNGFAAITSVVACAGAGALAIPRARHGRRYCASFGQLRPAPRNPTFGAPQGSPPRAASLAVSRRCLTIELIPRRPDRVGQGGVRRVARGRRPPPCGRPLFRAPRREAQQREPSALGRASPVSCSGAIR